MASVNPAVLPFSEAIEFFKAKIHLPSSGWTDIWQEQHSHAFVVAGVTKDGMLQQFASALLESQEKGTGYDKFREEFLRIASDNKDWVYKGAPGWRSRVIWDTNITQSYNAGRYKQMVAVKDFRPFWEYEHTSVEHPRLQHLEWDGIILPADDEWWNTHMPQNGWGCKCRVNSLTRFEAQDVWQARGQDWPDTAPQINWVEKKVGKTGAYPRTVLTPEGIDPGFGYNPGKAWLEPFVPSAEYANVLKLPAGVNLDALPINTASASQVYPDSVTPREAASDYLAHFGASFEQSAVVADKTGTPLVIGRSMFIKGDDKSTENYKYLDETKVGRFKYMRLLADATDAPDEIWQVWEPSKEKMSGRWFLQRYYLKKIEIEDSGKKRLMMAVARFGNGQWQGVTTFHSERKGYETGVRIGRRAYKK